MSVPFDLILVPHNTDYDTLEECKSDWEQGRDFRILDGPLCSSKDAPLMKQTGFGQIMFTALCGRVLLELPL